MSIRTVRNLRRISQTAFFLIFCWLILKTNFEVDLSPADASQITLPYPVSIALQFDPLSALVTLLANGTLYKGLLWCLVILIPTIFLGRFFCGWVCPMGTLNHWISEIPSERLGRKGAGKIASNRYKPYQRIKYYILFVGLAAALGGAAFVTVLSPLPFMARSLGTFVLPSIHTAALGLTDWFGGLIPHPAVGKAVRAVYDLFALAFLPFRQNFFHTVVTIGVVFIVVLMLNRVFTRFWCRAICPLGALLGVFSRYSIFGLAKDESTCDHCGLCNLHCQGADNPDVGARWRSTECHLCLNCQAICPHDSLKFTFFPNLEGTRENPALIPKVDVTRRKVLVSAAGGFAALAMFRASDLHADDGNPVLVRPPGSASEDDFLARCIRCGQCMRVCPNNALHPTLLEAGLEGLWSPYLIARIGYCEPTCTLCGQVCPTGAIVELTQKQKVGDKETPPNRIGTAFVDRGRCLPWAMAKPCIVCEEWCPTSPKSIFLEETTVFDSRGQAVPVKLPHVDPELCTGCGACEYACPVADKAAIRITSVGESRSAENQILLQRKGVSRTS